MVPKVCLAEKILVQIEYIFIQKEIKVAKTIKRLANISLVD